MSDKNISKTRYSDKELDIFKAQIDERLNNALRQESLLLNRLEDTNENQNQESDWKNDTSSPQDLELIFTMLSRQRKHIRDLKNALIRIENKNYGICVVTGQLIDAKRLMAVPTTTKSVEAKNSLKSYEIDKEEAEPHIKKNKEKKNKILTRYIKKQSKAVDTPIDDPEEGFLKEFNFNIDNDDNFADEYDGNDMDEYPEL